MTQIRQVVGLGPLLMQQRQHYPFCACSRNLAGMSVRMTFAMAVTFSLPY